jgi:hypothetical protein
MNCELAMTYNSFLSWYFNAQTNKRQIVTGFIGNLSPKQNWVFELFLFKYKTEGEKMNSLMNFKYFFPPFIMVNWYKYQRIKNLSKLIKYFCPFIMVKSTLKLKLKSKDVDELILFKQVLQWYIYMTKMKIYLYDKNETYKF